MKDNTTQENVLFKDLVDKPLYVK